jgi:hypothetical protein
VVSTKTCSTIADGLATRTPVLDNVLAIRELVDAVHLVSEGQILDAIRHLHARENVLAEPAGAATTAAWMNPSRLWARRGGAAGDRWQHRRRSLAANLGRSSTTFWLTIARGTGNKFFDTEQGRTN